MQQPDSRFLCSRLKTRHWLLLAALAETANVHRAAESLFITQPAASKLLREMEQLLEVSLFERLPRGVRPTHYGEVLISHAQLMMSSLEQVQEEVIALKSGSMGQVALGTVSSPSVQLLPSVIAQFKRECPKVQILVEMESSHVLLERMAQDKLDIVVGRLFAEHDKRQLHYEPLSFEPVCAVGSPDHPLLNKPGLSLADLCDYGWVLPPAGSILRHRFDMMFQRANLPIPENIVESLASLFIARLVENSHMLTVLAADVAQYYQSHGMASILPVALPCHMDDYGIITRAGRLLSPAAQRLVVLLREQALKV